MSSIAVFSGTSEGHKLIKMLCGQQIRVTAFVNNDNAEQLIDPAPSLKIMKGSLSRKGIEDILEKFTLVVDATHSTEVEISDILREASKKHSIPLLRVKHKSKGSSQEICVDSADQAVEYLNEHEGNFMISIGTKELTMFSNVVNVEERGYVRVKPRVEELLACNMAGFSGKQVIAIEGPVSPEFTHAQMKEFQVKYLVMKENDVEKSFLEEAELLQQSEVKMIVIKCQARENATSAEETLKLAMQFLG